jgi:hypothetical protein
MSVIRKTSFEKEDFDLQEAISKLPAHLRRKKVAFSGTNSIMILFPKKHKEATILKMI